MEFVKYCTVYYPMGTCYNREDASSIQMCILGSFLFCDVSYRPSSFKEWLFDEKYIETSSNATALEKENGCILIRDLDSEEEEPTQLRLTYNQFFQILTDWEEKVLKVEPEEVIVKYENDQFIFETKN